MSEAYLVLMEVTAIHADGWIWIEMDKYCILSPIPLYGKTYIPPNAEFVPSVKSIWAGFPEFDDTFSHYADKVFLDYQYIFDPLHFATMQGGMWETFRKNSRKVLKTNPVVQYLSQPLNEEEVWHFIGCWIENKEDTVEEGLFLADFAFFSKNDRIGRKFLYLNGVLAAINAWDSNYMYINYRVCMCDETVPYISEFARLQFYQQWFYSDTLVNDGGCLGSPSLEKFKDKMNPVEKIPIYTLNINQ